jgi:hypothetical protein
MGTHAKVWELLRLSISLGCHKRCRYCNEYKLKDCIECESKEEGIKGTGTGSCNTDFGYFYNQATKDYEKCD